MYIDSQVTNILKIKVVTHDNTGYKTYRRHTSLIVNSVYRLNIKNIKFI